MMRPGEKKVLPQPLQTVHPGGVGWVDGAVQTLFGEQSGGAGRTMFGGKSDRDVPTLSVLATDLLLIGIKLSEVNNPGEPEPLQRLLLSYFKEFERACAASRKPAEMVEQVRFALTAFIDEAVINTGSSCRDFWINQPLQVRFFNDHLAGESFFARLMEMVRDPKRNLEALEVYYQCLALGFQGRYRLHSPEKLPVILNNLLKAIIGARGAPPKAISPSANVHPGRKAKEKTGRLWIAVSAGVLGVSALLYFGLMWTSSAPLEPARIAVERLESGSGTR